MPSTAADCISIMTGAISDDKTISTSTLSAVRSAPPQQRLPRRLVENPAHRFAIQLQLPGDLGLRSPLNVTQSVHLPPAVLADHPSLPE